MSTYSQVSHKLDHAELNFEKIDSTDLDGLDDNFNYEKPAKPNTVADEFKNIHESNSLTYKKEEVNERKDDGESDPANPLLKEPIKSLLKYEVIKTKYSVTKGKIKPATIEQNYGKQLESLTRSCFESMKKESVKPGSFSKSWNSILEINDACGKGRIQLGESLKEMCESLNISIKHTERTRKELEKKINDQGSILDKTRQKIDAVNKVLQGADKDKNVNKTGTLKLFKGNKSNKQASEIFLYYSRCKKKKIF
ncbi:hypothetical protein ROZALSC1DRAFT_29830, partial [Rozella allomycis CSF55]